MSIIVSNVTKNYGSQVAVNNISFSAVKGGIIGFLGPNGAGKSTTMKMITGYLQPDAGTIEAGGINVAENAVAAKKKIGYLPEANPLYYDMYVREYLGFIAGIHGIKNKARAIDDVIAKVGLRREAHKKTGALSKGYKQRTGLAAALVHDPEILILDEPTSGLDPNQIIEIRSVIKELSANKTVLFSSHILQEVEALCERVIIINKGNIVADDQLKNLQRGSQQQSAVAVSFREAINIDILRSITGVASVQQNGSANFLLRTASPETVRKDLLARSIENNWNIVSLQNEENSLEDIFRSLTKG